MSLILSCQIYTLTVLIMRRITLFCQAFVLMWSVKTGREKFRRKVDFLSRVFLVWGILIGLVSCSPVPSWDPGPGTSPPSAVATPSHLTPLQPRSPQTKIAQPRLCSLPSQSYQTGAPKVRDCFPHQRADDSLAPIKPWRSLLCPKSMKGWKEMFGK